MRTTHLTGDEIMAYAGRTLPPSDALEISDHLMTCAECREAIQREEKQRVFARHAEGSVTYEELAAYIDNQLDPLTRREVGQKLSRSSQARHELQDLIEFKKEIEAEGSGVHFQEWILPIAAGFAIAALFGWWNLSRESGKSFLTDNGHPIKVSFDGRVSGIAQFPLELRDTLRVALNQNRIDLPASVAKLQGARQQLAGQPQTVVLCKLISPVGTAVATLQPVFHWTKVEKADFYRVTVLSRGSDQPSTVTEVSADKTDWQITKPLEPGQTYQWQVEAIGMGKTIAQAPTLPEPDALFYVLDRQQQEKIVREREHFGHSHLALGLIYARAGLIDEANEEFRALQNENPESDLPQKLRNALTARAPHG